MLIREINFDLTQTKIQIFISPNEHQTQVFSQVGVATNENTSFGDNTWNKIRSYTDKNQIFISPNEHQTQSFHRWG